MNDFEYKTMSKSEVANAYNISVKTLNKKIRHIVDIGHNKLFTPKQVQDIIKELGAFTA